jgi:mono/diheme cytochrome c family protein
MFKGRVMKVFLLFIAFVVVGCSGGKNSTGFSGFTDMEMAVPYEAFTEHPIYENGQTNQLPQPNTIARGFMPHPMNADGEPMILENPYEYDQYAQCRGLRLYKTSCAHCHGQDGKANGLVVTEGGYPQPPKFTARRWKKTQRYPSGYVYNIITYGYGNMASHGDVLKPRERWYVAEFVRRTLMRKGLDYDNKEEILKGADCGVR